MDEDVAIKFATYEDFLDTKINDDDLYYLEDEEIARYLVELGYRGSGAILSREQFLAWKMEYEASLELQTGRISEIFAKFVKNSTIFKDLLQSLFAKIIDNKSGKMKLYFTGRQKLMLRRHSDLIYHNWTSNKTYVNSSPNFHLVSHNDTIIQDATFQCHTSNRTINMRNVVSLDFVRETDIQTRNYTKCEIFDVYNNNVQQDTRSAMAR